MEIFGSEFVTLLKNNECIKTGHTGFYNEFHGDGWVSIENIQRFPVILDQVAKLQAQAVKEFCPDVEIIISPAISGAILGSNVARHLGIEFAVTYGKGEEIKFQRGYAPKAGLKACIVEDLVFSGTDIRSNLKFLRGYGIGDIFVSCWINRQGDEIDDASVISLQGKLFNIWVQNECPLCKDNIPLEYINIRE